MRCLILALLVSLSAGIAKAEAPAFAKTLKSSLSFRVETTPGEYYPHLLKVYLRLANRYDAGVDFVVNGPESLQAEVYDEKGKPVRQCVFLTSIMYNSSHLQVPVGSSLNWLISSAGGVTLAGDRKKNYALILGGNGWLLPRERIGRYTLRVRLRGTPWTNVWDETDPGHLKLLVAPPSARIRISR